MIIDDTFRGVPEALQTFQIGRPDLSDRPGDALIAIVREFRGDGGFARLQAERHADDAHSVRRPGPPANFDRQITRWFEGEMDDTPAIDSDAY